MICPREEFLFIKSNSSIKIGFGFCPVTSVQLIMCAGFYRQEVMNLSLEQKNVVGLRFCSVLVRQTSSDLIEPALSDERHRGSEIK